jgi:hypothetical protein
LTGSNTAAAVHDMDLNNEINGSQTRMYDICSSKNAMMAGQLLLLVGAALSE